MKIEKLNEGGKRLWQNFIKKNEDAKIQHTSNWRDVIEKTYPNCISYYYIGLEKNKVKAIFPFFLVKSKIFGNRMISLPFLDNGGFLGDYTEKKLVALIELLKKKSANIEIRLNSSFKDFEKTSKTLKKIGFNGKKSKQQFIIKLISEEDIWKKFHKHTRNDIRKAQKSGLYLKKIENEKELKKFYTLYFKEMKNFGTPQHSYKFFGNLFELLNENVAGFNCYFKEKIAGSIIMFYNKSYGYISFNISDNELRDYRPNDLLYWETIKWALKNNIKYIDLGQIDKDSKDTKAIGLYKFKRKWLGEIHDRIYFYYPKKKEEESEKMGRLKKFRKMWKRIPSPILKIIGPKIASQLAI